MKMFTFPCDRSPRTGCNPRASVSSLAPSGSGRPASAASRKAQRKQQTAMPTLVANQSIAPAIGGRLMNGHSTSAMTGGFG